MDNSRPEISFTFPLRWLNDPEDRKFLKENLLAMARRSSTSLVLHQKLARGNINAYQVVLKTHAYQPVKIKLTIKQVEEIFNDLFIGAKCASFETFFVQTSNTGALPMLELEIYY